MAARSDSILLCWTVGWRWLDGLGELGDGFLHFRLPINLPFSKLCLDRSNGSVIIGSGDSLKRMVYRKVCQS